MLSKYILENEFINQYTYSYYQNILINNISGSYIKVYPDSYDLNNILTGGSIILNKNHIYFNVLDRNKKKHYLYKVDSETKNIEILKTYLEANTFNFYPQFYFEQMTNSLYILDIDDKKNLIIVDSIHL